MLLLLATAVASEPFTFDARLLAGPLALRAPGLVRAEGRVALRLDEGWRSLDPNGPPPDRLRWWDQVDGDGDVAFGRSFVALASGGRVRLVTSSGEETLPADAVLARPDADDVILTSRQGDIWRTVGWRAGERNWEIQGVGGVPVRLGDQVALEAVRGGHVLIDAARGIPTGALPPLPGRLVGGFGGCRVYLPDRAGDGLRCEGEAGTVWSDGLAGDTVSLAPVHTDLDEDGVPELVVLTDGGWITSFDEGGRRLARHDLGPWSGDVRALLATERGVLVVFGGEVLQLEIHGRSPGATTSSSAGKPFGDPASDPAAEACTVWLDRYACLGLAERAAVAGDVRGEALAHARACRLGEGAACTALAVGSELAEWTDGSFWEQGCRLGLTDLCRGLIEHVTADRRAGAARLACARGLVEACSFEEPAPPAVPEPGEPVEAVGRVLRGGEPVPGVRIEGEEVTTTDRRGRFRVRARDRVAVVVPGAGEPLLVDVGAEALLVELPVLERVVVPVDARSGRVPEVVAVTGCLEGRRAVQRREGEAFVELWAPEGSRCALSATEVTPGGPGARWTAVFTVGEPARLTVDAPPRSQLVDLEGRPLAWVDVDGVRTDGDGRVDAIVDGAEPCPGVRGWRGYEELCWVTRWPVDLSGAERFLVLQGEEVRSVPAGRAWLRPGRWEVHALGAGTSGRVRLTIDGPARVHHQPDLPGPTLQVLDPTGRAVAGQEVETPAGTIHTDVGGMARHAGLVAGWTLSGTGISGRGTGRVVRAPVSGGPVGWRDSPLGPVVDTADPERVDVHPGDLLHLACGYRGLRVVDLPLVLASGCPAVVFRGGREVEVTLPPVGSR